MRDTPASVRRFLSGHRAVETRRRQVAEERGPLSEQAVAECLDALDILERMGHWPGPRDPVNERDAVTIRRRWAKLKRGYRSAAKA